MRTPRRHQTQRANTTLQRWVARAGIAAGLLLTGLSAPAASATPPTPLAPDGTAQAWVDFEGATLPGTLQIAAAPANGGWVDATLTATPFGLTAIFEATAGNFDLRFRTAQPATVDLAVTFTDANGVILEEALLRSVALSPQQAGSDGWIPWSALTERSKGAEDQLAPSRGADAGGRNPLAPTGQLESLPAVMITITLLALAGGAVLFVRTRNVRKPECSE